MRNWWFAGVAVGVVMLMLLPLIGGDVRVWGVVGAGLFTLLSLAMLLRSVILPQLTVARGMDLIRAQDFNNRLTKVGQRDADRTVTLFNTMIDRLREERLRNLERESFMRLLTDASPMGVAILDFDGKISMVNPAFMKITGIENAASFLGHRLSEISSDLVCQMPDIPEGESRVIRRGDVRRYRCYHLSFMQSGFSRPFYLLETLTEEMMRAEREAYEKVIRIISHEVNNTMGGVRSVFDTIAMSVDDPDIAEVLESCDDRCARLSSFINAYADVVRVPAPVKRPEPIDDRLREMLPFLRQFAREGVEITLETGCPDMTVDIDLPLFQQALVNIVKNAVESIPESGGCLSADGGQHVRGHVSITTRRETTQYDNQRKERVLLEVADDGTPITAEVANRLFNPFFTTKPEGCGIGLTLTGEILSRHGITYSLRTDSDSLTRFRLLFP